MAVITCHRVQFAETDAVGIAFYPNYFRWFDLAAHEFFRAAGMPVKAMLTGGLALPLVGAEARFLAALRYDDEIEIETAVADVRAKTFRLHHTIRRDGDAVAEGRETRIWARFGDGGVLTPGPIPDDVRRILEQTVNATTGGDSASAR
ncbi:MAG TPA: thioesterase family protein [Chloroflexota bacterium]|nr:thioesterase family protein [Chloroflexota bacterium]